MKHIHTFLLVAVGLVGLAVSGPVMMEGTAQSQQHSPERGQILDKRASGPPPPQWPEPIEPLPYFPDSTSAWIRARAGTTALRRSLARFDFDTYLDTRNA
ncbi:hypothetical protein V8E36_001909 [Tilletia maclaganii]